MNHLKCHNCALAALCMPHSVPAADVDRIEAVVERGRPLQSGDYLFRDGDAFHSLYMVSSGALRLISLADDGEQRVAGFVLPGEMAGLGGIAAKSYTNSAQALDTTMVCRLPFSRMEDLCRELPGLQHYFFEALSRDLVQGQSLSMMLSCRAAEERLAVFLWGISVRQGRRGLSTTRFRLPMSRMDIASYLGLTPETVSRVIQQMRGKGLVEIDGREVHLPDLTGLTDLAGAASEATA